MPPFIIEVMPNTEETHARLAEIPNLTVSTATPLSRYTRFGIGGPADLYAETGSVEAFIAALAAARSSGIQTMVIGGGTNLIVSDRGFRGIVLRYRADRLLAANGRVMADAGAVLQDLVDFSIAHGLKGLETLSGIPGSVGRGGLRQCGRLRPLHLGARGQRALLRRRAGARVRQRGVRVPLPGEHFQAAQGVDHLLDRAAAGSGRWRRRCARRPTRS